MCVTETPLYLSEYVAGQVLFTDHVVYAAPSVFCQAGQLVAGQKLLRSPLSGDGG